MGRRAGRSAGRGLREFPGDAAHELRSPLARIRAQAAHALAQADPAAWRAGLIDIADTERRASRLIDQLLALARAGEAQAGLTLTPIALDAVVRDIVLRFLPRADAHGVDLGAEGLDRRIEVRGDAVLVEGIVGNLLDNALRHGRGDTPRVTVALRLDSGAAVVSVTDNGPGLNGATVEQVTRRWARGPRERQRGEGAGLGLAIVARYAQLLNARLILDDAVPGPGLCASVRFEPA